MSLDKATVARIARLARISMPDEDLAPMADELSGILKWIEQLNEVGTAGVEPMTSVVGHPLHHREPGAPVLSHHLARDARQHDRAVCERRLPR